MPFIKSFICNLDLKESREGTSNVAFGRIFQTLLVRGICSYRGMSQLGQMVLSSLLLVVSDKGVRIRDRLVGSERGAAVMLHACGDGLVE